MNEDNRTYTDEEFALVLSKAAQLAARSHVPSSPTAGLSLENMKAAAAEAGLDPSLVERAAHLLASRTDESSLLVRRLSAAFPITLTEEETAHVQSLIRVTALRRGVGEATTSALFWRDRIGGVSVTVQAEGMRSRVRVWEDQSFALTVGGFLGALSGFILFGIIEPGTAGTVTSLAGGLSVAAGTWASITSRAKKRVDALMDTIALTIEELAARSDRASTSAAHGPLGGPEQSDHDAS